MLTIGIDPGRKGGVAYLHPDGMVEMHDLPYDADGLDALAMYDVALGWRYPPRPVSVVVEQVGGAMRDASSNAFVFGRDVGAMLACIRLAGFEPEFVPPIRWKTRMGLKGRAKKESLALARKLYPHVAGLERAKHEGRAEALLIAHFHKHGGIGRV